MSSAAKLKKLVEESQELKILYVEDDDQLREVTIRLLTAFFKNIDCAENGQLGFDLYKTGDYDIVISDLRMPVMDGIEMVKQIKGINFDQIVIITSAHDESKYLMTLIRLGVESFILKPLDVEQFLAVLGKAVRLVNFRRIEAEYTKRLEETVEKRTKELSKANEELEEYSLTLEQKVTQRTAELNETLKEVERANKKVMDSIAYAYKIQSSLLPNLEDVKKHLPNSFFIWQPRDIVGGDIYFIDFFDDRFIISVMDCTGHGVPGALMTMIASSELRRIIRDEKCHDPAEILKRLNFYIKTSLQQDTEFALSNDGLDAAICLVDSHNKTLDFAGARLPLITIHNNEVSIVKGDRESVGYKSSDLNFDFTCQTIEIEAGMYFYLHTDGFIDQVGGPLHVGLGRRRLREMLMQNHRQSFEEQKVSLLRAFDKYKGENETRDDFTIVGFSL